MCPVKPAVVYEYVCEQGLHKNKEIFYVDAELNIFLDPEERGERKKKSAAKNFFFFCLDFRSKIKDNRDYSQMDTHFLIPKPIFECEKILGDMYIVYMQIIYKNAPETELSYKSDRYVLGT